MHPQVLPYLLLGMHAITHIAYLDWLRPPLPSADQLFLVDIKMIMWWSGRLRADNAEDGKS